MVLLQNLSKVYRSKNVETTALRSVTLKIEAGEFVCITGPSGSGKSTLLSIIGLLESPTNGTLEFDGENTFGLSDDNLSRVRRDKIGFVFQNFNLLQELDVFQNIEVPLRYQGVARHERTIRVNELLKRLGLSGRAHHYPSTLSGGQQQRVAIARALVADPRIILADEPTGNLDSEIAGEILQILKETNDCGVTIIMVSHNEALANTAHRRIHIVDGSVSENVN